MEKQILEALIEQGLSQRAIAKQMGIVQSSVKYWLRKHDLKTQYEPRNKWIKKCCRVCGEIDPNEFYKKPKDGYLRWWCKKCHSNYSIRRFRKYKLQAIEYKGGQCIKCGYSACPGSMDFHHRNPNEKDLNWDKMRTWKFERVKDELDKCDLMCKNCHNELHWNEFK